MNSGEMTEESGAPDEENSALQASPLLDYATVSRYWSNAKPSIMGPYMMDGFGFPGSAGTTALMPSARLSSG